MLNSSFFKLSRIRVPFLIVISIFSVSFAFAAPPIASSPEDLISPIGNFICPDCITLEEKCPVYDDCQVKTCPPSIPPSLCPEYPDPTPCLECRVTIRPPRPTPTQVITQRPITGKSTPTPIPTVSLPAKQCIYAFKPQQSPIPKKSFSGDFRSLPCLDQIVRSATNGAEGISDLYASVVYENDDAVHNALVALMRRDLGPITVNGVTDSYAYVNNGSIINGFYYLNNKCQFQKFPDRAGQHGNMPPVCGVINFLWRR